MVNMHGADIDLLETSTGNQTSALVARFRIHDLGSTCTFCFREGSCKVSKQLGLLGNTLLV